MSIRSRRILAALALLAGLVPASAEGPWNPKASGGVVLDGVNNAASMGATGGGGSCPTMSLDYSQACNGGLYLTVMQ